MSVGGFSLHKLCEHLLVAYQQARMDMNGYSSLLSLKQKSLSLKVFAVTFFRVVCLEYCFQIDFREET